MSKSSKKSGGNAKTCVQTSIQICGSKLLSKKNKEITNLTERKEYPLVLRGLLRRGVEKTKYSPEKFLSSLKVCIVLFMYGWSSYDFKQIKGKLRKEYIRKKTYQDRRVSINFTSNLYCPPINSDKKQRSLLMRSFALRSNPRRSANSKNLSLSCKRNTIAL